MPSILEHIERLSMPEPNTGCWLWIGFLNPSGYGILNLRGRPTRAHRLSYEVHRGPIPPGLQLDHLCRVRCCVNPDHLEPVTNAENARRSPLIGRAPGSRLASLQARMRRREQQMAMTHCHAGHQFSTENTRVYAGRRHCRECARERYQMSKSWPV